MSLQACVNSILETLSIPFKHILNQIDAPSQLLAIERAEHELFDGSISGVLEKQWNLALSEKTIMGQLKG